MKSRPSVSTALLCICVVSLILPLEGIATGSSNISRSRELPVRIDTEAFIGLRGRLVMRLSTDGKLDEPLTIRWTAQRLRARGTARSGDRVVVVEATTLAESIDDVMTFEVQSANVGGAPLDIVPEFEFEPAEPGAKASRLSATGSGGAPFRVALTPVPLVTTPNQ
jgi:hypothetical protein